MVKRCVNPYRKPPFYGSPSIAEQLRRLLQRRINRKRDERLMRIMGPEAIHPSSNQPNTSAS